MRPVERSWPVVAVSTSTTSSRTHLHTTGSAVSRLAIRYRARCLTVGAAEAH